MNLASTMVIRQDGKIASTAAITARSRHYAQLGAVVTHPEYRRRGYAFQCVSALCARVFAEGKESVILFTSEANEAAQALYCKLGFRETGKYLLAEYA